MQSETALQVFPFLYNFFIKNLEMKYLTLVLAVMFSSSILAQNGNIRGKVIDEKTGETIIGANVIVQELESVGAVTDLDGNFTVSAKEGTYSVKISFVSYQPIIVEDVEVKPGETNVLGTIILKEESTELTEVKITAKAKRTSEAALTLMKKKSPNMLDGISSEKMDLVGDGDAAEAAKRVTGVSVEGGKYVYIRGLGDRYTKTTLNGMEIPGLDPDRNSLQMDIFPTNLIDNIMISKNFSAENPADYTGGLLNVETKGFPEEKFLNISVGLGYNPSMHFNDNYLTYEGSSTDYLGFDNGERALPKRAAISNIPTPLSGASSEEVNNFVGSFNSTLAAERKMSLMDFSVGVSLGDQFDLKKEDAPQDEVKQLGYIFSLTYKVNYKYYSDVEYSDWQRAADSSEYELISANRQTGELGSQNVLIGALGGLALKTKYSKYRLTVMHLQNAESKAGKFTIDNNGSAVGQSGYLAYSDNLSFNERGLTNFLLNGNHVLKESGWEVEWGVAPTLSNSSDPDIRKTAFTITATDTSFSAGAGGNPSRIWRDLQEINLPARLDFTKKYQFLEREAKLKFGASYIYKQRDYEILFFDMQFWGQQSWEGPDASVVLDEENIYPNNPNGIYYQSGNGNPNPNKYSSTVHNSGLYISNSFDLFENFKTILGVRAEYFVQYHTGRDQKYASGDTIAGNSLNNETVLNSLDFFPEANLIYTFYEKFNLRGSYSMSIARPSFKELSFAQILDPITNRIFNGSLFEYSDWDGNLVETRIHNADLRWEMFMERGQIISLSGFYKFFNNPIELVRIPEQQTSTEYQPRNVGDGYLFGVEFELRKNLDFISEKLEDLNVSCNFTYVKSQVEMTDTEYEARKLYEKAGQNIDNKREMQGQAPYVINAGIAYNNRKLGLDVGVFYNVKGPTLFIVGSGLYPDIYVDPFHSLNFGFKMKLGEKKNAIIEFNAENLIGDNTYQYYSSYQATDQTFSRLNPGRKFSIGFKYKF